MGKEKFNDEEFLTQKNKCLKEIFWRHFAVIIGFIVIFIYLILFNLNWHGCGWRCWTEEYLLKRYSLLIQVAALYGFLILFSISSLRYTLKVKKYLTKSLICKSIILHCLMIYLLGIIIFFEFDAMKEYLPW